MRKTLIIIGVILAICLIVSSDVSSQQSRGGKFIRKWVALGPIITGKPAPEAIETDYPRDAMGLEERRVSEFPTYYGLAITTEGCAVQIRGWMVLQLPEDGDVNRMLVQEEVDNAVAYLIRYVTSEEACRRDILIRSDDAVRVWVNGEVVYTSLVRRSMTDDEDRFTVDLRKGRNNLMLKTADTAGDWTLSLRFANDDGLRFFDYRDGGTAPVEKPLIRLPAYRGYEERESARVEAGVLEYRRFVSGEWQEGPITERRKWENYQYTDGLVHNEVNAVHQDHEGIMWFGTSGGVSCFDGKEWSDYTTEDGLAHNHVWSIYQDREGRMWFGTSRGVSRFDGEDWATYTEEQGLAENHVKCIQQDLQGNMWFGTYAGVSRFDGKEWTTYTEAEGLSSNHLRAIHRDREGNMWFGTNNGLSRFDGREWIRYYGYIEETLVDSQVYAIYQDDKGRMWSGTHDGVSCFDGRTGGLISSYMPSDGLAGNRFRAIGQDSQSNMWFGADQGGISCFDGKGFTWYLTRHSDYVIPHPNYGHNYVRAIYRDREGSLWFGTAAGVSRFDPQEWAIYTTRSGLADNYVRAIHQDNEGNMWFGTGSGVSRFDGSDWANYTTEDGLANNRVYAIHQDNEGSMWFGTYGGASRFDGKEWIRYTQGEGLANNCVYSVYQDREGSLWFGMSSGSVSRFDGSEWANYTVGEGLEHNHVYAICQDRQGNMWFGVSGYGVSWFDGEKWYTYSQEDGLASEYVHAICQDSKGNMWLATDGAGVSCFDGEKWTTYKKEEGLASNHVYTIHQSRDGSLWFGTYSGVSRFDGRCFQSVNSKDGLVTDNVQSIYADKDGNIWIGTDKGVARFTPGKVAPLVHINQMIADKPYDKPRDAIRLPSNVQRISLAFRGISFKTRPEEMKYLYQLVGRDADWLGPTREETVDYLDLKPGRYTFQVQAVDRDLNYSDPPASLGITISSPPFYKSGLFIILAVAAALCIPFIVYSRQKRKSTAGFEPIPNPYMAGGPVRSEEMFFGREEDFRFVKSKLETEKEGIVIVFCGQRRSGKTSLLHQIRNGRLGEGFMPVLIDMQEMAVNSDGEFYERIAEEVSSDLSGLVDVNLAKYNFHTGDTSPALVFEEFMDDVMERADDRTLLLMFDEYELLEEKMNEGTISSDTPTFFAGTLERHPRISFIFTGSRHLEARNPKYWRILFGKSTARRISLLGERDTLRLVKEPVADAVRYQRGVPERIYRLTGGQPFYTQHICQLLIDRLNQLERHKVYADDVEKIALELADNSPPQMSYFWNEELGGKEKLVLVLLGRMLDSPDSYVSASMVAEYAASREEDVGLEMSQIARILDGLCEYELLERERVSEETHEYRYKIDIFRYWVQRHQSIGQAMDEVDGESADG